MLGSEQESGGGWREKNPMVAMETQPDRRDTSWVSGGKLGQPRGWESSLDPTVPGRGWATQGLQGALRPNPGSSLAASQGRRGRPRPPPRDGEVLKCQYWDANHAQALATDAGLGRCLLIMWIQGEAMRKVMDRKVIGANNKGSVYRRR